jgi:hypothetical protein
MARLTKLSAADQRRDDERLIVMAVFAVIVVILVALAVEGCIAFALIVGAL